MSKKIFLFFLFLGLVLGIYFRQNSNFRPKDLILSPLGKTLPSPVRKPRITLAAVGDIMLGRNVNKKMHDYQDFTYPFKKTADFLQKADITFGNLESPFFENCPVVGSGTFIFCADNRSIEGLRLAGFDVLSLENNHILNYGKSGLSQTIELLKQNDISPSTSSELTISRIGNTIFGFLSFNFTSGLDKQKVIDIVRENVNKIDVLIVSLHWGEEYKTKPSPWQTDLAHQLIDLGVLVILGHHSHWVGEIEPYGGGLIFYSLGNFVFDQMWSQETRKGLVVKINFLDQEIENYQTRTVTIFDYSQPSFD